jgi:Ca2+-binding RTX toxin-like protein
MRKAFLLIPTVLAATLVPSISKADVPTCFGQPATLVAQPGEEDGDTVVGTAGPDVIVGSDLDDDLYGRGGNDLICGMGDGDKIVPGAGNDKAKGGYGRDKLNEYQGGVNADPGDDLFLGGPDDDVIYASTGNDILDGGAGREYIDYRQTDTPGPVTVNLATGEASVWGWSQTVTRIEEVVATDFDDALVGDGEANALAGGLGSDTLVGNGGDDNLQDWGPGDNIMRGGPGDDRLAGTLGNDTLRGGKGTDLIDFSNGHPDRGATLYVNLAKGIAKGYGTDSLEAIENVSGSHLHDVLIGDSGPNILESVSWSSSSASNDILVGRGGNDFLDGANRYPGDSLDGGRGSDRCSADEGDIFTSCEDA